MKIKLLFLFILFFAFKIHAQQYVFGKVSGESAEELAGVTILNVRTDERAFTDIHGNFMIKAEITDELRFSKKNYDRFSVKISNKEISKSIDITLNHTPKEIAEVEIKFKPTGNLRKDSRALDQPQKVVALNENMSVYMKTPSTEVVPKASVPSSFAPPNFGAGQVDAVQLLGAVFGVARKAVNPKTSPNYSETQEFYRRVKQDIDLSYYKNFGLDEFQLEEFIVYADRKYQLAKNFRKNFDKANISSYLMLAFKEYQKTHIIKS